MTKKRDLKRLVRERQERTGESYTSARRQVIAHATPADGAPEPTAVIPVIEMLSFTSEAKQLGFACRVVMASSLASRVDPIAVLERVRDALRATADDPGMRTLRNAVLRGELAAPEQPRALVATLDEVRPFIARARAGIGGVSDSGSMMALPVDAAGGAVMVIAHVGYRPVARPMLGGDDARVPRLVLTTIDQLVSGPDQLILWLP